MKIVIDDLSRTSKGSRREREDWRRAFWTAGLIEEGHDAGHGIGRAIAGVLAHFNVMNEPPAGNRGAKNMGAERRASASGWKQPTAEFGPPGVQRAVSRRRRQPGGGEVPHHADR